MNKKIQAHRGFSSSYPESTLLAYEKAFEQNIFGLECDIHLTKDNQFVIIHDFTIDRTVQGGLKGNVIDYTLLELKQMYFSYPTKFSNLYLNNEKTKILTLQELFDYFKDEDIMFILQLQREDDYYINSFIDIIVSNGLVDRVWVFGSMLRINKVRSINKDIFTINDGMPGYGQYNNFLNNAVVNNHNGVSINSSATDTQYLEMIKNIHSAGKVVMVSYLSSDFYYQTKRLIDLGVDYVLGDNPQLMVNDIVGANSLGVVDSVITSEGIVSNVNENNKIVIT